MSVQHRHRRILLQGLPRSRMWTMHREPRVLEAEAKVARLPCKDYLKGTCTTPFCEKWHPPECLFYKTEEGCKFGNKCSCSHRQVDEQPGKKSKTNGDKIPVAILKITWQLGCVFQDVEPPKSSSILRKSSNILKPSRSVQFTKAVLRHANIRDQKPSLGAICPSDPHQRNPNSVLGRVRKARAICPWSSMENGKMYPWNYRRNIKQHSPHLRRIGVCLRHQQLNQRKENLLWTPVRRCTGSAKRIWIPLNWKPWQHKEVRWRL